MTRTGGDVLIEVLEDWGVDVIFGFPGDGINGIIESLRKAEERIRFVQVHLEKAAAFMACAYTKYTGKLGVCLATSGPGGIHLMNGLYDAKMDGQPVLAITGHHFHDLIDTHAQQDIPLDRVFADVACYTTRVMGPEHVSGLTHLACRMALSRRSVAHVNFPVDFQSEPVKKGERTVEARGVFSRPRTDRAQAFRGRLRTLPWSTGARSHRRGARTQFPLGGRATVRPLNNSFYDPGNQQSTTRRSMGQNRSLSEELEELSCEVRFGDGDRALYATDASNYRMPPIGVVLPRSREEIIETVRIYRAHGTPILSRGGGTGLAGQCCNYAVVMDLSKYYNRIPDLDTERKLITVEPGIVLDEVQKAVAPHGLIFGPNPATHNHCTIGGMTGNNSCGINSLLAALHGNGLRTSDNLERVEVLTYDGVILDLGPMNESDWDAAAAQDGRQGEIYASLRRFRDQYGELIRQCFPKIPRRVSGYNLDNLLPETGANLASAVAGSEGTCIVILSATLKLVPKPKARSLLVLGYPDAFAAGDHVVDIFPSKPIGLEGIDRRLVQDMQHHHMHAEALAMLPKGHGWLLVEFGGETKEGCDQRAREQMDKLRQKPDAPDMKLYKTPEEANKVWEAREAALGATAFVAGQKDTWPGWEDTAVAPEKCGPYLRDLRKVFEKYGYDPALYGHFGQGCIHCRVSFDLLTEKGLKNYCAFLDDASDLVVRYGGSFSVEHGDGQSRAELPPKMYGRELIQAFREFKAIWDPEWKMNPGKVVDPNPILSHLRLGTDYNPERPKTYFSYPQDQGDFSRAVLRCVGVGECRRHVILWPDTFNNHYHPEVARAATEFLERSGWSVIVPKAALCCGRPLYDYGRLDMAKAWMLRLHGGMTISTIDLELPRVMPMAEEHRLT